MFRGLIACLLVSLAANSVVAVEPEKHVEVIIFLVDRTGSMNQLPEPDTTQAALTEAIQVAILSGRPVRIAIILFNGNGVKILGDDKDMPTSAMKTLHKRLMNEWEAPLGGTPLDEALQQCVRMVKDLPSTNRCTVVNIGDGHPASGRLRADDFSEIQDEMDRQLKAIHAQPYPPAIIQNLVDQRKAAWGNPMTEEFTKLYEFRKRRFRDPLSTQSRRDPRHEHPVRFAQPKYSPPRDDPLYPYAGRAGSDCGFPPRASDVG